MSCTLYIVQMYNVQTQKHNFTENYSLPRENSNEGPLNIFAIVIFWQICAIENLLANLFAQLGTTCAPPGKVNKETRYTPCISQFRVQSKQSLIRKLWKKL